MEVDIFQVPGSVFRIRIRVRKAIEYGSRYRKALNTGTASEYRKPLNKDPDHDRKDWLSLPRPGCPRGAKQLSSWTWSPGQTPGYLHNRIGSSTNKIKSINKNMYRNKKKKSINGLIKSISTKINEVTDQINQKHKSMIRGNWKIKLIKNLTKRCQFNQNRMKQMKTLCLNLSKVSNTIFHNAAAKIDFRRPHILIALN